MPGLHGFAKLTSTELWLINNCAFLYLDLRMAGVYTL